MQGSMAVVFTVKRKMVQTPTLLPAGVFADISLALAESGWIVLKRDKTSCA